MASSGTVKATEKTSSEHESRWEVELILLSFSARGSGENRPKTLHSVALTVPQEIVTVLRLPMTRNLGRIRQVDSEAHMSPVVTRSAKTLHTRRLTAFLVVSALALPLSFAAPAFPQASGRTIGLVITNWRHALYETPDMQECPAGLTPDERDEMNARSDAAEQLRKFGYYENRGPNGEMARYSPQIVQDRTTFSELKTKVGHGLNLDGTDDGRATAKSCRHDKFTSPEGKPVDNQLSRVLGCTEVWRTGGSSDQFWSKEIIDSPLNRILIEITGVDDERNDPAVDVTIYKGRDREIVPGPASTFIPFLSQRVDDRYPKFTHRTRGKIIDGVLYTEAVPVAHFPVYWIKQPGERKIRDLQLRLQLSDTGAEGLLGGYEDLKFWWNIHSKAASSHSASQAAYYRAMVRYADGYPDSATGQCTAISAGYKIKAVRAMIVHPNRVRDVRVVAATVRE